MPFERGLYRFGGGALVGSGILFLVLALLDLRIGPPPSNGSEVLAWRDSHALALGLVSEFLFFAIMLLVPAVVALHQSLADVDRTKATTGCGIIAATVPAIVVLLIVHGRLVYPVFGMRIDTPEVAALAVIVFYGGLHAVYLLLGIATIILSLAMKRGAYAKWIAYLGFATGIFDIIGSYPWAIGPITTLVCQLFFSGWFVAVGSQLFRMRGSGA